ncbi:hypothetical protein [Aromatoleum sp.]|uniref:hypothetical protein n=1 Tax=Aromatoleum sp. TaxID=2307007 RepID=UPI002FC87E40
MFPLLPFAAGLLTGAVATRLLKVDKARTSFNKAQDRVREATVSSLAAIEHTSAELRAKLIRGAEEFPESENGSPPQAETFGQPQEEGAAAAAAAFTGQTVAEPSAAAPKPKTARVRARTKRAQPAERGEQTEKPDEEAQ